MAVVSRLFAQRVSVTNGAIFIVVLDANHGVRSGGIGVPTVPQSFGHAVCTPETCSLGYELFTGLVQMAILSSILAETVFRGTT